MGHARRGSWDSHPLDDGGKARHGGMRDTSYIPERCQGAAGQDGHICRVISDECGTMSAGQESGEWSVAKRLKPGDRLEAEKTGGEA